MQERILAWVPAKEIACELKDQLKEVLYRMSFDLSGMECGELRHGIGAWQCF
ncbi:MAG: hypothetical protein ACXQTY_01660 [Candidatus Methanogasteraceae archaeon]